MSLYYAMVIDCGGSNHPQSARGCVRCCFPGLQFRRCLAIAGSSARLMLESLLLHQWFRAHLRIGTFVLCLIVRSGLRRLQLRLILNE